MADEIALNKAIERAARAKALLNDDVLKDAFATLEGAYINAWRETGVRDADARERLWQATQIVGKVRDHMARLIGGGTVAQAELDQIAMREKRNG